jgi:hypothetical protein
LGSQKRHLTAISGFLTELKTEKGFPSFQEPITNAFTDSGSFLRVSKGFAFKACRNSLGSGSAFLVCSVGEVCCLFPSVGSGREMSRFAVSFSSASTEPSRRYAHFSETGDSFREFGASHLAKTNATTHCVQFQSFLSHYPSISTQSLSNREYSKI